MNEAIAIKVLEEVKGIFDLSSVEFWLDFGTLLGAVREGKFITYDDDIELGMWMHKITEDKIIEICRKLSDSGFIAYYSTLVDYISINKKGVRIAVHIHTLDDDKAIRPHEYVSKSVLAQIFYWISELFSITRVGKINKETISGIKRFLKFLSTIITNILRRKIRKEIAIFFRLISMKMGGEYGITRIPAKFHLKLRDLKFYNAFFKAPVNSDEYLAFVYGPNWGIPVKNWNYYKGDNKSITKIEFIKKKWDYRNRMR